MDRMEVKVVYDGDDNNDGAKEFELAQKNINNEKNKQKEKVENV